MLCTCDVLGVLRFKSGSLQYITTEYTTSGFCKINVQLLYTVDSSVGSTKVTRNCDGNYHKNNIRVASTDGGISCVFNDDCSHILEMKSGRSMCVQGHEAFEHLVLQQSFTIPFPCDAEMFLFYRSGSIYAFGGKNASVTEFMSKSASHLLMATSTIPRRDRSLNASPQLRFASEYMVPHSVDDIVMIDTFDMNKGDTIRCRLPKFDDRERGISECVDPAKFEPGLKNYSIAENACAVTDYLNSLPQMSVNLLDNCSVLIRFPSHFIGRTYHMTIIAEDFEPQNSKPLSSSPTALFMRVISVSRKGRATLQFSDSRKLIQLAVGQSLTENLTCKTYCPPDTLQCTQSMTKIIVLDHPSFFDVSTLRHINKSADEKEYYKVFTVRPVKQNCGIPTRFCAYCSDAYSHSHISCQTFEYEENGMPCQSPAISNSSCPKPRQVPCPSETGITKCVDHEDAKKLCKSCERICESKDECDDKTEVSCMHHGTRSCLNHSDVCALVYGRSGDQPVALGLLFGLLFLILGAALISYAMTSGKQHTAPTESESFVTEMDGQTGEATTPGLTGKSSSTPVAAHQATDEELFM